jgi:hypothetical protein
VVFVMLILVLSQHLCVGSQFPGAVLHGSPSSELPGGTHVTLRFTYLMAHGIAGITCWFQ